MNDQKPFLTIITPAYNRADLLKECFRSLQRQSDRDFQWIVVDDGSTDHTDQVMKEILRQKDWMDICFVRKENGGKHTALNASHPYIKGGYVLILDSDDTLTEDAVEADAIIAKYPLSADKILRMFKWVTDNGFASFSEA